MTCSLYDHYGVYPPFQPTQPCEVNGGGSCSTCQELALLESEISATADTLARLVTRHRELRSDTNQTHSSFNRLFPVEVISSVFNACVRCELEDKIGDNGRLEFTGMPFVLGSICRTWRQIAWSTPKLWTTIAINLNISKFPLRGDLARQWLEKSGELPLSVQLYSKPAQNYTEMVIFKSDPLILFDPLILYINTISVRWQNLRLVVAPVLFSRFCGDGQGAPILQQLHLEPDDYGELDEDQHKFSLMGPAPKPRDIYISALLWGSVDISWENVTTVWLDTLYLDECIEVIRQAPQLEICTFHNVLGAENYFPMPSSPVVRPKIRELCVGFENSSSTDDFFDSVIFPNLEIFTCDFEEFDFQSDGVCLLSFLDFSSRCLKKMSILSTNLGEEGLIRILRATPSISHLHLKQITTYNFASENLLSLLARSPTPLNDDTNSDSPFLPNLQRLDYQLSNEASRDFAWKLVPDLFRPLPQGIEPQRRPLKALRISFFTDQKGFPYHHIEKSVIPWLIGIKLDGIDLEVLHEDDNHDIVESSISFHGISYLTVNIVLESENDNTGTIIRKFAF